jgi:squalene-hopene/tetraprenyl-beta-curcumene cyclase
MLDGITQLESSLGAERYDVLQSLETETLVGAVRAAQQAMLTSQHADGYWSFELEADCTIPAEYILMMHFMGEIEAKLQAKLANYIRAHQTAHGGWPLYHGGDLDLSCTIKAYYALKLAGDSPQAPHMVRARQAILARGGAAHANVFTRIALAFFGQLPWRAVPFMPVEIVLLPRWFPFHIDKISYWSRTVMVPLLILCSLKARAKNPLGVGVQELFTTPPEEETDYFPARSRLNRLFLALDRIGRWLERLVPASIRARAIQRAEAWFIERLNGRGGLGAIFPAMVNAYEALAWLGYPATHRYRVQAREALKELLVVEDHSAYCQPCVSPVWDTALTCLALQEARGHEQVVDRALQWLRQRQLGAEPGDWRRNRLQAQGGGWPFQFYNSYYPDLDDTGAVAWAMLQSQSDDFDAPVRQAAAWVCCMQSRNGGFAAFDVDNTYYYLNEIPFADHGALLDPPTADVSARCAVALHRFAAEDARFGRALQRCLDYLRAEQEPDGSWFGRWGTNYIYGTWSVLAAFEQVGVTPDDPAVRRAVQWLKGMQHSDGGWGESNESYFDAVTARSSKSTAFQTAWAMLALTAAGEGADSLALKRGAEYLMCTQLETGLWRDEAFTAPGFPRVFYLKYHGYQRYFPLWALARYRNLRLEHYCQHSCAGP